MIWFRSALATASGLNSYVTDQLLAGLRRGRLLTQMRQKGAPTGIPACHSQGEAGWELDLHLELPAGAEKMRQWAHAGASLLRQMCCKFARIVTATAVTQTSGWRSRAAHQAAQRAAQYALQVPVSLAPQGAITVLGDSP